MNNEIEALKALIFEIYAAGYQDSINNIDIVKGWNKFWENLIRRASLD
jgi:hypothetical protein